MTTARARGTALALAALLLWAGRAEASNKRGSEVVVVEGPEATAVAGWLEDSLNVPDTAEQEETFRGALRARGALPLRLAAGDAGRTARLIACAHAAAGQADVDGALLVALQKTRQATKIHVWRIDTRPGGAVIESELTLSPLAKAVDESRAILAAAPAPSAPLGAPAASLAPAASMVAPAAAPIAAPPPPPVKPAPAPVPMAVLPPPSVSTQEPDRVARPSAASNASVLALEAAFGLATRHFSYTDRVTPTLRPYDLAAAPMASLGATVYPLAFTRTPALRDLGITGDYAQAFAFGSEDSSGAHVGATWRSFDLGATERIHLTDTLALNISLGYGGNDFKFDQGLASSAAALPSVSYRFVRAAADVRVAVPGLTALAFSAGGAYLDLLHTGYTNDLFPRQTAGGVDAHVGASYAVAKRWQLSVDASYLRIFYAFNPIPGDANVAGGALDQQGRVLAGLSYVM